MQIKWLVHFTDGTKVEVTASLVGKTRWTPGKPSTWLYKLEGQPEIQHILEWPDIQVTRGVLEIVQPLKKCVTKIETIEGTPVFVINWQYRPGILAYVTKNNSNRKPYTSNPQDPDTKIWKTRKAAERYLSLKDRLWAADCVIEECPTLVKEK